MWLSRDIVQNNFFNSSIIPKSFCLFVFFDFADLCFCKNSTFAKCPFENLANNMFIYSSSHKGSGGEKKEVSTKIQAFFLSYDIFQSHLIVFSHCQYQNILTWIHSLLIIFSWQSLPHLYQLSFSQGLVTIMTKAIHTDSEEVAGKSKKKEYKTVYNFGDNFFDHLLDISHGKCPDIKHPVTVTIFKTEVYA